MRKLGVALLVILIAAFTAAAQPPDKLDAVLRGWEKALVDVQSFAVVIDRTATDKSVDSKDTFNGHALFNKADKIVGIQARLQLVKSTNKDIFEEYIFSGNKLYEYAPAAKQVRVHAVPKDKIALQQETLLSFLFDVGVQQAKARYNLQLVERKPADGYYYIHIEPKQNQDKQEFVKARLALARANNLPAQIWYVQQDGKEITWNFTQWQVNVQLKAEHFTPALPPGWRFVQVKVGP